MDDEAHALVDELLIDLDDRSGFDTGGLDEAVMSEWRERWAALIGSALTSARAEGYAKAREQAAKVVGANDWRYSPQDHAADIRVMQDERADVVSKECLGSPDCGGHNGGLCRPCRAQAVLRGRRRPRRVRPTGQSGAMSYARLSYCDVYVLLSVGAHLECCMCSISGSFTTTTTDEMVAHLDGHRAAGHDVPDDTYEGLRADQKLNDRWMDLVAKGVDEDAA